MSFLFFFSELDLEIWYRIRAPTRSFAFHTTDETFISVNIVRAELHVLSDALSSSLFFIGYSRYSLLTLNCRSSDRWSCEIISLFRENLFSGILFFTVVLPLFQVSMITLKFLLTQDVEIEKNQRQLNLSWFDWLLQKLLSTFIL